MQLPFEIIPINNLIANTESTPVETDATFMHVSSAHNSTELVGECEASKRATILVAIVSNMVADGWSTVFVDF